MRGRAVRGLSEIPDDVKLTLPDEVKQAIDVFSREELEEIKLFLRDDDREVDCVGFVGPDGRACKYADPVKYEALLIIEDSVREEIQASRSLPY